MQRTAPHHRPLAWWRPVVTLALVVPGLVAASTFARFTVAAQSTATASTLRVTIAEGIPISDTGDLHLFVTISELDGRPVPGLGRDAFKLSTRADTGQTTPVSEFAVTTESDARAEPNAGVPPMDIAVVMDLSTSMQGRPIAEARAAAIDFIESRPEGDRFALYTFGVGARQQLDFSADKSVVKVAIAGLDATEKGTSLNDAIALAAGDLGKLQGRRAFIVLTDGQNDAARGASQDEARAAVSAAEAPGFMLGFGSVDAGALQEFADAAGGRALVRPGADDIAGLMGDVGKLLDQYVITFHPTFPEAVSKLRVNVEVNGNDKIGSDFLLVVADPSQGAIRVPTAAAGGEVDGADGATSSLPIVPLAIAAIAVLLLAGAFMMRRRAPASDGTNAGWPAPQGNVCLQCGYPAPQHDANCPIGGSGANWPPPPTVRPSATGLPPTQQAAPPPWPTTAGTAPPTAGTTRRLTGVTMGAGATPTRRISRPVIARAHLVIIDGARPGEAFALSADDVMVGRGEECQVQVDDGTVSRDHARLRFQGGQYVLFDQNPTNPSRVDGEPAHGRALRHGDRVTFGRTIAEYRDGPPPTA